MVPSYKQTVKPVCFCFPRYSLTYRPFCRRVEGRSVREYPSGPTHSTCQDRRVGEGRSMRERMLAGEPYLFDASLHDDTRRCRLLLERINGATADQDAERDTALRELLG